MTPKEKAKDLVEIMLDSLYDNGSLSFKKILYPKAKQCAIIAVDEIISLMIKFHNRHIEDNSNEITFWQEVKQEINKL